MYHSLCFPSNEKKKLRKKDKTEPNQIPNIIAALLFVLGFFLYSNTLSHGFVLDDFSVIKDNPVVTKGAESIPTIFSTPYRYGYQNMTEGNIYRPLPVAIFALQWAISPDNPSLGHWTNVLCYAFLGCLLFFVLFRLFREKNLFLAFLISLIFICHPIHTEVVSNIKSLDEILALLFFLLATRFLLQHVDNQKNVSLGYALFFYLLAMFSKESAITFLAVFPLVLYFFREIKPMKIGRITGLFLIPAILFLGIRMVVIGDFSGAQEVSILDNSLVGEDSFGERFLGVLAFLGTYFQMLYAPHPLVSDLGYNQFSDIGFLNWRVIVALIILIGGIYFAIKKFKEKSLISFGFLFLFITISISSNLLILIGTNYGERLLFAPSLGAAILIGWGISVIFKNYLNPVSKGSFFQKNKAYIFSFLFVFGIYGLRTMTRNLAWESNYTLYSADIKNAPNSARVNYQYGHELAKKGQSENNPALYDEALYYFEKAVEIYPQYSDAYGLIGIYYNQKGNKEKALENYLKGLEINKNDTKLLGNIGKVLAELGRPQEALPHFEKALKIAPNDFRSHLNMGVITVQLGNLEKALNYFLAAEKLAPNDPSIKAMINQTRQSLNDK